MVKAKTVDAAAAAGDRSFLGRDFLTWLWFRCEVEGGEFDISGTSTAVMVEDALALVSAAEDGSVMTLRKGTPTTTPQAASALAAGMALKKARLFVARGPREWQFTLDGETLDMGGLKTPEIDDKPVESSGGGEESDPADPESDKPARKKKAGAEDLDDLAEKLLSAEEAREVVEGLYKGFLDVRLGKDWERIELPRMCDWVGTKVHKASGELGLKG
jgi:recombination associated protein RdgC